MEIQIATESAQSQSGRGPVTCRFCHGLGLCTIVDLGMSPLCETYPAPNELQRGEIYYPLHVYLCESCFLVQIEEFESPDKIFQDYPYFSSYSDSWLKHSEQYCRNMTERFGLDKSKFVVEVASNDGYLLQYFQAQDVPVLGIEPAANVAQVAIEKGIPTLVAFFGASLARQMVLEGNAADLVLGNNVLAQVPNLNDFVEGLATLLKPQGVLTLEFPHLLCLLEQVQFDTIYHEHFSYFSLTTAREILARYGLTVFDVDQLMTHGGSLRLYACRTEHPRPIQPSVSAIIEREKRAGLNSWEGYARFADQVRQTKISFVSFLMTASQQGKRVAGYGAPGKSATLLNYCGIGPDLLEYTVDRNPHKQGRLLPGSHIPIHRPDRIRETKPDYVVILPWNLKDEIMDQIAYIREWGGKFVVPIPSVEIY